jgi:transcriptional regulator with XRE-family HTH domain
MNDGQKLIRELKTLGYSQKEIARYIGTYPANITWYVHGTSRAGPNMVNRLNEMLQAHISKEITPTSRLEPKHYTKERKELPVMDLSVIASIIADNLQTTSYYSGAQYALRFLTWCGLPQTQLASILGVSPQYISSYLNGRIQPTREGLLRLYEILEKCIPDTASYGLLKIRDDILPLLENQIQQRF